MQLSANTDYYYLTFDYIHVTDWTMNTNELTYTFKVFNSYIDSFSDYALELAILSVKGRGDLRGILRVLSRHRNIKGILSVKPLNDGYPKNLQVILKGDAGDSTRFLAHMLGGIEVKAVYEHGIEHWGFLFPSSERAESFLSMIKRHGRVLKVKANNVTINDVIPEALSKAWVILNPTELRIIRRAYEEGFFEVPRRINLSDLAREMGVSKATLDTHIRNAISKLIRAILGGDSDEETNAGIS